MRRKLTAGAGVVLIAAGIGAVEAVRPSDAARSECTSEWTGPAAKDTTDDLRLRLNVPAYRLDVVERGRVSRSISVAVGQPKYRTPLGHFQIDYVVWNPWWRPPDKAWARKEHVEPPGWDNPTGRVKLHVTELVFMHGTPLENSRGSAASHACVRMSNDDAITLARLVHQHAGPVLPPALLDSLVADTNRTRTIALARTVPVDFVYQIGEVRADTLLAYRDIYGLVGSRNVEQELVLTLLRAGLDTAGLQRDSVHALARAARRGTARMAIAHLLMPVDQRLAPPPILSIAPRA